MSQCKRQTLGDPVSELHSEEIAEDEAGCGEHEEVSYWRYDFCTEPSGPQMPSVRFEVFTAVTMKNAVVWDITT
jgi:hypothetical protein